MALEDKVGRCGQSAQSARAAAQLGCASKGGGGTREGRQCLNIACRLEPPGPSRCGHCAASRRAGVMEA